MRVRKVSWYDFNCVMRERSKGTDGGGIRYDFCVPRDRSEKLVWGLDVMRPRAMRL